MTAVSLLKFYRARIQRLNSHLNAIVTLDETMMDAAHASDARLRAGRPLSVLDGIPIAIKDNLLVKDLRTTWGSSLYGDFVPDWDEGPIARLRDGGQCLWEKQTCPRSRWRGTPTTSCSA